MFKRNPSALRKGCVTGVGYKTHLRHNETPCKNCLDNKRYKEKSNYSVEKKRQYREKNKEHISKVKKAYRESNKKAIKKYAIEYQQKNAEKIAARKSAYKKANPEKIVEISNRRRARKLNALTDNHTVKDVISAYGKNCHICGIEIDLDAPRSTKFTGWKNGLHIDHLIPLSKGGSDLLENVRPSHAICNMKKHVTF